MKKLASITAIAAATVLTGCAGQLYIHTDKSTACVIVDGECTKYKGVPFYPLKEVKQHYLYDRVLDAKGNIVRHFGHPETDKQCTAFIREESAMVPDYEKTYVAEYVPEWFETVAFTVSLSDKGTLSSIGANSTPGGKALADTLIATTTKVRELSHGFKAANFVPDVTQISTPLCSAGKIPVDKDYLK